MKAGLKSMNGACSGLRVRHDHVSVDGGHGDPARRFYATFFLLAVQSLSQQAEEQLITNVFLNHSLP